MNDRFPAIIVANMNRKQVDCFKVVLKRFKWDIGWTIAYIIGIPLGIFWHTIQVMLDHKTRIEHQRGLNPLIKEVVKKKIIKWLYDGVIYPTVDSVFYTLCTVS